MKVWLSDEPDTPLNGGSERNTKHWHSRLQAPHNCGHVPSPSELLNITSHEPWHHTNWNLYTIISAPVSSISSIYQIWNKFSDLQPIRLGVIGLGDKIKIILKSDWCLLSAICCLAPDLCHPWVGVFKTPDIMCVVCYLSYLWSRIACKEWSAVLSFQWPS